MITQSIAVVDGDDRLSNSKAGIEYHMYMIRKIKWLFWSQHRNTNGGMDNLGHTIR
jgi:hypothetical protein